MDLPRPPYPHCHLGNNLQRLKGDLVSEVGIGIKLFNSSGYPSLFKFNPFQFRCRPLPGVVDGTSSVSFFCQPKLCIKMCIISGASSEIIITTNRLTSPKSISHIGINGKQKCNVYNSHCPLNLLMFALLLLYIYTVFLCSFVPRAVTEHLKLSEESCYSQIRH